MPTGTVSLTWNSATKEVTAAVDLWGLTPGSSHAMHIHPGVCKDQTKPPSIPFPDITADAMGVAKQTLVSKPAPAGIPTGAYINVHLAPMATVGNPGDVSFTSIACGDIAAGTTAAGPVTVKMSAPPTKGVTPAGTVALAYDAAKHSLHVDLTATGLPANSAHAVHIHKGTCAAQGDVVYPLPDLQADASGKGTVSTTVQNVTTAPPATGWYVNVHMGPMSQILAGDKPTMQFAPILCANVKG
ncbi:CHRD domain-containing protein [Nocardia sp. NEAU-G5]|uniref:CHRD domain-containing protein n=1 Tax=Nocardia albiluteola TaxID=2842303 RepID=A0ABS6ATY6_9NOCA|nr:CHRD domain-containing protein [Nocardia albiluteola]MBU3061490.1 CHRD domain-containing protein [Nocardia albiluteola]